MNLRNQLTLNFIEFFVTLSEIKIVIPINVFNIMAILNTLQHNYRIVESDSYNYLKVSINYM